MARYSIKEIHYTLQGEGYHSGRPAVFLRFTGCNLWTGREVDRDQAICQFCDTDFIGTDGIRGGKYTLEELVTQCDDLWPPGQSQKMIVCTGGEPALQLDDALVQAMQSAGWYVAVETNGTLDIPTAIDWITLSPKAGADLRLQQADELKLVYPQAEALPQDFSHVQADHYYLQPMDGPQLTEYTQQAIAYCQRHPQWHLSLQLHKLLNIY